jgi:formyltetrahydrofolate synthetase
MENIKVRCRSCNRELEGHPSKTVSCGCSNMTTIRGEKISAVDLSLVVMLNAYQRDGKKNVLSNEDILWQEERRRRKVRKLDFEVR